VNYVLLLFGSIDLFIAVNPSERPCQLLSLIKTLNILNFLFLILQSQI